MAWDSGDFWASFNLVFHILIRGALRYQIRSFFEHRSNGGGLANIVKGVCVKQQNVKKMHSILSFLMKKSTWSCGQTKTLVFPSPPLSFFFIFCAGLPLGSTKDKEKKERGGEGKTRGGVGKYCKGGVGQTTKCKKCTAFCPF